MSDKLKEIILNIAKDIFENQPDEPLTQSEIEDMLFEFANIIIRNHESRK